MIRSRQRLFTKRGAVVGVAAIAVATVGLVAVAAAIATLLLAF